MWWKIPDFFRSLWSKNQSCFLKVKRIKLVASCQLKPLVDKLNKLLSVGYYCLTTTHILVSSPHHTHNKNFFIVISLLLFSFRFNLHCAIWATSHALSPLPPGDWFSMNVFIPIYSHMSAKLKAVGIRAHRCRALRTALQHCHQAPSFWILWEEGLAAVHVLWVPPFS